MDTTTMAWIVALNLCLGIVLALLIIWVVEQVGSIAAGTTGLLGAVLIITGQAWVGEYALAPLALSEFKPLVLAVALSGVAGLLATFTSVRPEV